MNRWRVTSGQFDAASRATFTVSKGTRRLDHREQDELEALLAGWVDADKQLPEYGEPCLIVANGVVQHVTYMRDGTDDSADWFEPFHYEDRAAACWAADVTYWMPLPKPPTK